MRTLLLAVSLILVPSQVSAQVWRLKGRVVMEDGSPPPSRLPIERVCEGMDPVREAITDRQGYFQLRLVDPAAEGANTVTTARAQPLSGTHCLLVATLKGYQSNSVDLTRRTPFDGPDLPPFVLRPNRADSTASPDADTAVPRAVRKDWDRAVRAAQASRWAEAERLLRAIAQQQPGLAAAWHLLGSVLQSAGRLPEARDAYRRAVAADATLLGPRVLLLRADIELQDWPAALASSGELLRMDTRHGYPEAWLDNALARFRLRDYPGAEASARQLLAFDRSHLLPRAEYLLGVILGARRDFPGAIEHLRQYLALQPGAPDAPTVRDWITKLSAPAPTVEMAPAAVDWTLPPAGSVAIPGGMKALGAVARIDGPVTAANFLGEYARAVVRGTASGPEDSVARYVARLLAYFQAAAELSAAAGKQSVITLSLADAERRPETERILPLLGWKVTAEGPRLRVEPGDREVDGSRQPIAAHFGIDEIAMQEALEGGRAYRFPLPVESARLAGGDAWSRLIRKDQRLAGGLAESFARDHRFAKVYAALSSMSDEAAAALVAAVGLRTLIERHADLLGGNPGLFALEAGAVKVPGTPAVWSELTGADPGQPKAFLAALLSKPDGRLAAFYAAMAAASPAQQRFYLATAARAQRFAGLLEGTAGAKRGGSWPARAFAQIPVDEQGRVLFPGGREVWAPGARSDEDALAGLGSTELLLALVGLEKARGLPLDAASAQLLAEGHDAWWSLHGYLERLPSLGAEEFRALQSFTAALDAREFAERNQMLGVWHSLVELIALGRAAGSVDASTAASAFRRACAVAQPSDAVAVLRTLTGAVTGLDDAVPTRLLRLDPVGRARFDRVKAYLRVPSLDDAVTLQALAGQVYAAWLDPAGLLVSEDPALIGKHRFLNPHFKAVTAPAFPPTGLRLFNISEGGYFTGGFSRFGELARKLPYGGATAAPMAPEAVTARPARALADTAGVAATADVFRVDSRLVEVHATVTSSTGAYVDNLTRERFQLLEDARPQPLAAFENTASSLTCAILLDVSGSMQPTMPALKNAVLKLIDELRPGDSVAVYSFNESVQLLQDFTTDRRQAKRAVLQVYPDGMTALYDGMARVARDLAAHSGKKVIVVFTDGSDNASALTVGAAVRRAKAVGAPVYSIAQGSALRFEVAINTLRNVSTATGGLAFAIKEPTEIRHVFESVAADLKHGYLLTYRPDMDRGRAWRRIEVKVQGREAVKVRSRDGYYPE